MPADGIHQRKMFLNKDLSNLTAAPLSNLTAMGNQSVGKHP